MMASKPDGRKDRAMPPQVLRDLRWVWENELPEGGLDETPARRTLRELLKADRVKYLDRLTAAEKDWRAVKAGKGKVAGDAALRAENERLRAENADLRAGGGAAGGDPGTEAALELVEKLLKEAADG